MGAPRINTELRRYRLHGVTIDGSTLFSSELEEKLREFGKTLGKRFNGFKSPAQESVVWRALDGKHTLAVLPTGAGKSLSFQLPAYCAKGRGELTLVVSPLRALMGMFASVPGTETINSDTDLERHPEIWNRLATGESYVLLVSPEKLARNGFQTKLCRQMRKHKLRFARFVVDEVHCLSDWGHDFRPHYWWVAHHLRAIEQRMKGGEVPRLLLTATADRKVIVDIRHHFPEVSDNANCVVSSAARAELFLGARKVTALIERKRALVKFLTRQARRPLPKGVRRRGIVYNTLAIKNDVEEDWLTRDGFLRANEVVDFLKGKGFSRTYAFASTGMSKAAKEHARERFEKAGFQKGKNKLTVLVATNAFGMGMDYSKVPFVCHLYPRPSISEYWQQVGRAGRDMDSATEWAETMAIFSRSDEAALRRHFAGAPAIDGLINAFTMPLHNWMYVWRRSSLAMSLSGVGGGKTKFAKLLKALQDLGIIAETPDECTVPRGALRYAIHLLALRRKRTLVEELKQRYPAKKLRKVFRYLLITAASRKGKWILLNQNDYAADRHGTVLQRLNRWVDIGALELDMKPRRSGEIRLRKKGVNLTARSLRAVQRDNVLWKKHKENQVGRAIRVLDVTTPEKRKQQVLSAFERSSKVQRFPHELPPWMRKTRGS